MDAGTVLVIAIVCLYATGIAGNIADRLAAPFAKMVAPLASIAASLATIAKQGDFEDCGDPNCATCNPDGEYVDDELDDGDFLEPESGGDDFRPHRKG